MDIGTIAATATLAGSFGIIIGGALAGAKNGALRKTIAARDNTIDAHVERIASQNDELATLGTRCSELRLENGRVKADNVRLAPDAEIGRRRRESLARDNKRKRSNRAARAAGNVTSIAAPAKVTAPKKPTRKSAIA